jgi:two-component system OmpR family sensor kinase
MNLRRKLFITFGGLAFMTLLMAGVTGWAMLQWSSTEEELREHYQRSLLLQEVRAQTLQAVLEVPEGLTGNDADARQDFEETIAPAEDLFEQWASLADTEAERREVEEVRSAYEEVVEGSIRAFDLIDREQFGEAESLFDTLEDNEYENFQTVALRAAEANEQRRQEIRDGTQDTRRTAQIMLAVASFGALSLVLLLAAYLASDLFSPLRDVREAIRSVRQGDRRVRLAEDRSDEVGDINREFNAMVAALADRERRGGAAAGREERLREEGETDWLEMPARLTLHRLVSQMRSNVEQMNGDDGSRDQLVAELRELSRAVQRLTEFSYPLDLNVTRTDVRTMIYGVVQRFQQELAERAVSLEIDISPEVRYAVVDRLKLRESLSEMIRNSLDALPERGGKIGLRARISRSGDDLLLEVADDGSGAEQSLIDRAFDRSEGAGQYSGLTLVRAVVEQHGGEVNVDSEPGEGTYVQVRIPLRE